MLRFIVRRLLVSIPLLLVASVLIFTVLHLTTDPAAGIRANPRATAADVQRYRHDLGLDRSGPAQYFAWLGNFVRGRWGTSLFTSIRVSTQIREALANSLFLGLTGFAIALLIGVDRKSTRLNSSHVRISYAVFCLKKKNKIIFVLIVVKIKIRDAT